MNIPKAFGRMSDDATSALLIIHAKIIQLRGRQIRVNRSETVYTTVIRGFGLDITSPILTAVSTPAVLNSFMNWFA